MKDKTFCRFEKKEVNTQYYFCPNRFINCEKCPKLKRSSKASRPLKLAKKNSLCTNIKQNRDPFSDWNVYPFDMHLSLDPKTNKPSVEDIIVGLEDSEILNSLIDAYEQEANKGKAKGMEAFWRAVEALSKWKQGNWECLNPEEKNILEEAKKNSIEAIQKLVIENPRLVQLPFVADAIEDPIRTVKIGDRLKIKEARKLWQGFLPKRDKHKNIIKDEHLSGILKMIMRMCTCTKEEASDAIFSHDPSISRERLRKISVSLKN